MAWWRRGIFVARVLLGRRRGLSVGEEGCMRSARWIDGKREVGISREGMRLSRVEKGVSGAIDEGVVEGGWSNVGIRQ